MRLPRVWQGAAMALISRPLRSLALSPSLNSWVAPGTRSLSPPYTRRPPSPRLPIISRLPYVWSQCRWVESTASKRSTSLNPSNGLPSVSPKLSPRSASPPPPSPPSASPVADSGSPDSGRSPRPPYTSVARRLSAARTAWASEQSTHATLSTFPSSPPRASVGPLEGPTMAPSRAALSSIRSGAKPAVGPMPPLASPLEEL
mmetsp:Transcript_70315/g.159039  ORF Transcript_70315/g.159039 Transcript_70315/m.159039 type:complete len:202 (+) Transcript_70315:1332-1937(+)